MVQVVLVDRTHKIDKSLLHSAAIALNQQVTKDLPSIWSGISATVSAAPSSTAVPHGAWPIFLVKSLPPGEGGFHMDKNNQPYAKVIAAPGDDGWTVDASHELVEMLVDPYGNRMHTSQGIRIEGNGVVDGDGVFNYLVEACDPCEANQFAYSIGGIAVSDFITPNYYDASVSPATRYSFKGHITRPRQMLEGGYISYIQPDGQWNQILWVEPGPPVYNNPSIADGERSLRIAVHRAMGDKLDKAKHLQRRKPEGLSDPFRARMASYQRVSERSDDEIRRWYDLEE